MISKRVIFHYVSQNLSFRATIWSVPKSWCLLIWHCWMPIFMGIYIYTNIISSFTTGKQCIIYVYIYNIPCFETSHRHVFMTMTCFISCPDNVWPPSSQMWRRCHQSCCPSRQCPTKWRRRVNAQTKTSTFTNTWQWPIKWCDTVDCSEIRLTSWGMHKTRK